MVDGLFPVFLALHIHLPPQKVFITMFFCLVRLHIFCDAWIPLIVGPILFTFWLNFAYFTIHNSNKMMGQKTNHSSFEAFAEHHDQLDVIFKNHGPEVI